MRLHLHVGFHLQPVVLFQRPEYHLTPLRREVLLVLRLLDDVWGFLNDLFEVGVVLAGNGQRALGAAAVHHHHIALQIDSGGLQLLETLVLQLAPDLLLR